MPVRISCVLAVAVALMVSMAGLSAQDRRLSKSRVSDLIKRVEVQSDALRRQVDRVLDRSALDGTRREDRINDQMKDLENELDRLRREFNRTDSWWETRSRVDSALREARDMQRLISTNRALRPIQNNWSVLRQNLNDLARAYGVPRI